MRTTFYAYKNRTTYIMMSVGVLILLLSSVLPLILGWEEFTQMEFSFLSLIPITIILFFYYVMIRSWLNLYTRFSINHSGLSIWKLPSHYRNFHKTDIETLEYLDEERTKEIVEQSILEQQKFSDEVDLSGYFQYIRKNIPVYKYFTLAPTGKVTTVGPKDTITNLQIEESKTGIIKLTLKDGSYYLLSPQHPKAFHEAAMKLWKWE